MPCRVDIEVPDRSQLPRSWEPDLRAAVENAGGRELVLADDDLPALLFSFVLDVGDPAAAEAIAQDVVEPVIGGLKWGIIDVTEAT